AEVQLRSTMLNLRQTTGPRFAKLDVFEVLPALRSRYPFLGGRLVPFLIGGVGTSFLDTAEHRPTIKSRGGKRFAVYPQFDPGGPAIVGLLGAGLDYFLYHHLSVGLIVPLHLYSTVSTVVLVRGHAPRPRFADLTRL